MRGRWIIIFLPERLNNAGGGQAPVRRSAQLGAHAHEEFLPDERLSGELRVLVTCGGNGGFGAAMRQ